MSRRSLTVLAVLLAALGAPGCATNPATGKTDIVFMSEAEEMKVGEQAAAEAFQQYARYDNEAVQDYVNQVGQRIVSVSHRSQMPFKVTVLDSDQINAFAVPGYIFVFRGLLAYLNSEAELAAVMGHEIAHVTARHTARRDAGDTATAVGATILGILTGSSAVANVAGSAGTALQFSYSREQELEADQLGAEYVARLGYDPSAIINVVRILKNQEAFEIQSARAEGREAKVYHGLYDTHPDFDTRMQGAVEAAAKAARPGGNYKPPGRDEYLDHIQGIAFGSSAAQGVVRGSRFYHADMGFTVAFPSGWIIKNTPNAVLALSPQRDAVLQLATQPVPPNLSPREFLSKALSGVPVSGGEELKQYGLVGYTALARNVPLDWGTPGPARFAIIYLNGMAYIFKGSTRLAGAMSADDPLFVSSIRTFRRLKDTEFELADANRIELVKTTSRTTIDGLAATSPIQPYPADQLRLLNDLYPKGEPTPGELIKIVK
ncbi:MAG: M48 family metalloprotease [Steroidobacteraceae bacterium]